jgi:hypothetical protein
MTAPNKLEAQDEACITTFRYLQVWHFNWEFESEHQGSTCKDRDVRNFIILVPATASNSSGGHGSTELCDARVQAGLSVEALGFTNDSSFSARVAVEIYPY